MEPHSERRIIQIPYHRQGDLWEMNLGYWRRSGHKRFFGHAKEPGLYLVDSNFFFYRGIICTKNSPF